MNIHTEAVAITDNKITIFIKLAQPPAPSARRPPINPKEALAAKPKASIRQIRVAENGPPNSIEKMLIGI